MDDFVLILGIFLVVLITILVFNKEEEEFSLCDGENPKKGGIFNKDTNFAWIDEGSILDWTKIGDVISSRPS